MVNKKELSEFLRVSQITIERLMKKGLPHYKLPNGTVRFETEEVKEWLKKGE